MSLKTLSFAAAIALLAASASADGAKIMIEDAYARSGPKTGAAFFNIMNHGAADDRLVGASSDVAKRVELHTHIEDDNGVVKMRHVEDGFAVLAGEGYALKRGGDHVMFMGLDAPFEDGQTISVTLTFEKAGDVVLEIPVDNARRDSHGGHSDHSGHSGHKKKDGHSSHGDHSGHDS